MDAVPVLPVGPLSAASAVAPNRLARTSAAGASLGLRVGAVFGGLYLLPVFALQAIGVAKRSGWLASARFIAILIVRLFPALAIALALMAVLWPWSVMAPGNILLAVHDLTAFHVPTILAGRPLDSYDIPGSYVPTYLLVKLPETMLAGMLAAVVAGAAAFLLHSGSLLTSARSQQWLLVVMAAFVPILYAIIARPAIYNGLRHFLFIIPPLCVLAAAGIEQLLAAARKLAGRWLTATIAIVLAAGLVKDVTTMVTLHPHQYVYYNLLAGGVRGADDRYELDYWSNFMREAIARLTEYVAAENGGRLPQRTFSVDLCTSPWPLRAYAPPQFRMTEDCRSADFFVSTTNTNCHRGVMVKRSSRSRGWVSYWGSSRTVATAMLRPTRPMYPPSADDLTTISLGRSSRRCHFFDRR